ncbi:MAG: RNA polymerase sigma factor [Planctomycetales bacterium]|nr:RNA polymerase sigma factor [Planctomycetales bacterium]
MWASSGGDQELGKPEKSDQIRCMLEVHLPAAYRLAMHFLGDHHAAQDVAQETMLRAWKNRKQVADNGNAKAWLLRVTANLCRDRLRRGKHPANRTVALADDCHLQNKQIVEVTFEDEQLQRVRDAVAKLNDDYRIAIQLFSVEGLSVAEIAEITGDKPGAIKVRLTRARAQIREILKRQGAIEKDVP